MGHAVSIQTPHHWVLAMTRKNETIDEYIRQCPSAVVPLLAELRAFILQTLPGVSESMQYGVPVFLNAHETPVVYLFGSKAHVNFGFLKSGELDDLHDVLVGSGRPSKHIKVYPNQSYDKELLSGFLEQCAHLKN